jgi:hypothetical protein
LPSIRHIPFRANMAFISIKKIYESKHRKFFEFLEAFYFELVEFGIWFAFASAPDSLVSSAKAFKKRLD